MQRENFLIGALLMIIVMLTTLVTMISYANHNPHRTSFKPVGELGINVLSHQMIDSTTEHFYIWDVDNSTGYVLVVRNGQIAVTAATKD